MIAYRVEHKEFKCGPYNVPTDVQVEDDEAYWEIMEAVYVCRRNCSGDKHLGPREEIFEWTNETHSGVYVFGFESLEQLLEWFDEETRESLAEVGYVIRTYEMSNFMIGRAQVIFEEVTAKPLTTLPLVG